jgi:glutathione S-transferase
VKLHFFPPSSSSRPVLLLCAEQRIAFEPVVVDLRRGAQHEAPLATLNPSHLVPVLEDGDFVLTECAAILRYLADQHAPAVYPKDARARARVDERLDWVSTQLVREWLHHLVYPQVFPDHRRPDGAAQDSLVAWGKQKSEHWLRVLDEGILGPRPYLCGDGLTIADYLAAEVLHGGALIGARFTAFPNVDRYLASMRRLPSWAKVNEAVDALAASLRERAFVSIGV